jgi:hypothetical protein
MPIRKLLAFTARRLPVRSFEHRLFFNNLVVVDMLFRSWNSNVIASNKSQQVLEWN